MDCFAVLLICGPVGGIIGCGDPSLNSNVGTLKDSRSVAEYSGPPVPDFSVWRFYVAAEGSAIDPDDVRTSGFTLQFDGDDQPTLLMPLHPLTEDNSPVLSLIEGLVIRGNIDQTMITEVFGAGDGSLQMVGNVEDLAVLDADVRDSLANNFALISPGPSSRRVRPLKLSSTAPKAGDTVWLAVAVYAGATPSRSAHEAEVTEVNEMGRMLYRFKNARLSLQAADGAPLLNPAGEVVGIHFVRQGDESDQHVKGSGVTTNELLAWKESLDSLVSADQASGEGQ